MFSRDAAVPPGTLRAMRATSVNSCGVGASKETRDSPAAAGNRWIPWLLLVALFALSGVWKRPWWRPNLYTLRRQGQFFVCSLNAWNTEDMWHGVFFFFSGPVSKDSLHSAPRDTKSCRGFASVFITAASLCSSPRWLGSVVSLSALLTVLGRAERLLLLKTHCFALWPLKKACFVTWCHNALQWERKFCFIQQLSWFVVY